MYNSNSHQKTNIINKDRVKDLKLHNLNFKIRWDIHLRNISNINKIINFNNKTNRIYNKEQIQKEKNIHFRINMLKLNNKEEWYPKIKRLIWNNLWCNFNRIRDSFTLI